MEQVLGRRRFADPRHTRGVAFAAALAGLGGGGVWLIAAAGVPAAVPVQYGPAAWLVPFAAGPAALCAAWSALALWRAARRTPAALAFFASAVALLLGLLAALTHEVRLVVLLSVVAPLVVAYVGDVLLLREAASLGSRRWITLLALAALPLAAVVLPWPGPLWSIAALLPVVVMTPLLAAAFLTGARPDGRPRGAPLPALAFFGLPVALLAGTGLAAGVSAIGGVSALLFLPLLFLFVQPLALLLVLVMVVLVGLRVLAPAGGAPAAPVTPVVHAPAAAPVAPAPGAALPGATGAGPLVARDDRLSRALLLFTDHFLAGHLSDGEYERQIDHLLCPRPVQPAQPSGEVAAAGGRPELIGEATDES